MATRLYVPGPASIAVGSGALGALENLGWSTRGFSVQIRYYHDDVMTDLSGPAVPEDVLRTGMDGLARIELARYSDTILAKLRSFLPGETEGQIPTMSIGTLLRCEGAAYRVLFRSPYAAKVECFPDMPPAWNFHVGFFFEPVEMPLGTRASTPTIGFRFIPDLQSVTSAGTLYDDDATGAPDLD